MEFVYGRLEEGAGSSDQNDSQERHQSPHLFYSSERFLEEKGADEARKRRGDKCKNGGIGERKVDERVCGSSLVERSDAGVMMQDGKHTIHAEDTEEAGDAANCKRHANFRQTEWEVGYFGPPHVECTESRCDHHSNK